MMRTSAPLFGLYLVNAILTYCFLVATGGA